MGKSLHRLLLPQSNILSKDDDNITKTALRWSPKENENNQKTTWKKIVLQEKHLSWGLADRSGEALFLPYAPVVIVKRDFTAFRADLSQV